MDHVPLPRPGLAPIEVPYVASLRYDSQDFDTFPSRAGFPQPEEHDKWQDIDSGQFGSLVQSWLYFGLIAAFLERPADHDSFIVSKSKPALPTVPNCSIVSSLPLIPLLDKWSNLAAQHELPQRQRSRKLLQSSVAAKAHLEALPQATAPSLPEVFLSINILIATLGTVAVGDTFMPRQYPFSEDILELERILVRLAPKVRRVTANPDPAEVVLTRELYGQGWCPFKVRHMLFQYSYLTIYYMSRLRKPTAPHITHSACDEARCIGNNVDMESYTTRHVVQGCTCLHTSVPEQEVRAIIAAGGIPVVRINASNSGRLSLEVREATPNVRYIAISHVWSDGLGNPTANSLPQCQLTRLARSIKHLMPPMFNLAQGVISIPQLNVSLDARSMAVAWGSTEWLWLDTLCIPVDAQFVDLKMRAISQMAAIYAGAQQILVLDSVMQSFSVAGSDICHIFAQLSAIAWLERSWTYQESAIAWSLQVQCADCSFDPVMLDQNPWDFEEDMYMLIPGSTLNRGPLQRARKALSWSARHAGRILSRVTFRPLRDFFGFPVVSPGTRAFLFSEIQNELRTVFGRETYQDRKHDFSFDADVMTDFVVCWNALTRRTTTMPEDIHIILANLLCLNAFYIQGLTTAEERMQTILWSLPGIPLAVLFNRSKHRVRPAEQHGNRWMPLWPDDEALDADHIFELKEDSLIFETGGLLSKQPRLIVLNTLYSAGITPVDIIIHDTWSGVWYQVAFHRQPGDVFSSQGFQTTAFIFDQARQVFSTDLPAACLHVSELDGSVLPASTRTAEQFRDAAHSASEFKVTATFDCPATVTVLGRILPASCEILPRFEARSTCCYTLAIKHDVPETQQPLPRRAQLVPFLGVSLAHLLLSSPGVLMLSAMNAIIIYQVVKLGDTYPLNVRVASYVTITIHSYTFLQPIPPLVLIPWAVTGLGLNIIPFIIGLVYVGLKAQHAAYMTAMDQAVLALLLCGHVPALLMAAFIKWYLNLRLYKAWLNTYSPKWTPSASDPWLTSIYAWMTYVAS